MHPVALPREARRTISRQNNAHPRQTTAPMEFTSKRYDFRNKDADYASLAEELKGLLAGEPDLIANAANTSALLFDALPEINWAGFYFLRPVSGQAGGNSESGELVVGPF